MRRTVVVGLGNPILRDDGVGIAVARALRGRLPAGVDVVEDAAGGLRLMERLVGYERAVVVDAAVTGAPPGTVRVLRPGELPTAHGDNVHDLALAGALAAGRAAGAPLPPDDEVWIVAVEAREVDEFGEALTPEVAAAVPRAVAAVERIVWTP